MGSERLTVAVAGATGQQGSHVVEALVASGHRPVAWTRSPDGAPARDLAARGIEVRAVDLDAGRGVEAGLAGADALFLVTTPFERGAEAEMVQATAAGRAAQAAGIRHVVYSSVTLPMTRTPIAHFAAKGRAEAVLGDLGLPLTTIGSPPFMDNVVAPWHLPWLKQGVFALPGTDWPMGQVAVADIAAVAVHVLERREAFVGERVDIVSDEISGAEMARILERVIGIPLRIEPRSFAELDPTLGELFAVAPGAGAPPDRGAPMAFTPDRAALHARLPEVQWHSFEDWARARDWDQLLGRAS